MSADWTQGYVTDLEYLPGFYADMAPGQIDLVCLVNSIAPPARPDGFAYCELGCGQGLTTAALAAANPDGEFVAIDFNPAHIARAEETARQAGLGNVRYLEASFEDLVGPDAPDLPMFDYVTMHGVWSWVSADLRAAITRFLAARLKPGGAVYLSYNALPGWTAALPLQHLIRGFAAEARGRSDERVQEAFQRLGRVAEAGSPFVEENPFLERIAKMAEQGETAYLAHEYLTPAWAPQYHAQVVADLAEAKLDFVGSTAIPYNFPELVLEEGQRALRNECADPVLRETLKDYFTNRGFRTDVFVRGRRSLHPGERDARIGALRLGAAAHRTAQNRRLKVPAGQIDLAEEVYEPIFDALAERPHRVADLLALPGLPPGRRSPVEIAGMLASLRAAVPAREEGAPCPPPPVPLNGVLGRTALEMTGNAASAVVLPGLGTALSCSLLECAVLHLASESRSLAVRPLAEAIWAPIEARGEAMIEGGRPVEGREANIAVLEKRVGEVIADRTHLWRMHGALAPDVA